MKLRLGIYDLPNKTRFKQIQQDISDSESSDDVENCEEKIYDFLSKVQVSQVGFSDYLSDLRSYLVTSVTAKSV